jgi:hypothetical protein
MPPSNNPKTPLALALVLAIVDGIETYVGVILMGGVEEGQLTRLLIIHYGALGLTADDLITVAIAILLYLMTRHGGVIGLFGLVTLNIWNGLRTAVVASNAIALLTNYSITIPLVVACGIIIGIALNVVMGLIKPSRQPTHGPGTGLKTTS